MSVSSDLVAALTETITALQSTVETKDRVRTPQGAAHYGQPIGSVIVADHSSLFTGLFDKVRGNGMTLNVITGETPTTGYCIAERGKNREIPASQFFDPRIGRAELRTYIKDHADDFGQDRWLGLWHDEEHDEMVLDVVMLLGDRDQAVFAGIENNQQFIYDVEAGDVIDTGGTGDRAAEAKSASGAAPEAGEGHVGRGTGRVGGGNLLSGDDTKVRHVRTQAGVERYGLPIGSPIVADAPMRIVSSKPRVIRTHRGAVRRIPAPRPKQVNPNDITALIDSLRSFSRTEPLIRTSPLMEIESDPKSTEREIVRIPHKNREFYIFPLRNRLGGWAATETQWPDSYVTLAQTKQELVDDLLGLALHTNTESRPLDEQTLEALKGRWVMWNGKANISSQVRDHLTGKSRTLTVKSPLTGSMMDTGVSPQELLDRVATSNETTTYRGLLLSDDTLGKILDTKVFHEPLGTSTRDEALATSFALGDYDIREDPTTTNGVVMKIQGPALPLHVLIHGEDYDEHWITGVYQVEKAEYDPTMNLIYMDVTWQRGLRPMEDLKELATDKYDPTLDFSLWMCEQVHMDSGMKRRVRTPAGQRRFHEPIGATILADPAPNHTINHVVHDPSITRPGGGLQGQMFPYPKDAGCPACDAEWEKYLNDRKRPLLRRRPFGKHQTKVRHVRTPEGSRRFKQPIGSAIVADAQMMLPDMPHHDPLIRERDVRRHATTDARVMRMRAKADYTEAQDLLDRWIAINTDSFYGEYPNETELTKPYARILRDKFGVYPEDVYYDGEYEEPPSTIGEIAAQTEWAKFGPCRDIREAAYEMLGYEAESENTLGDPNLRGPVPQWGGGDQIATNPHMHAYALMDALKDSYRQNRPLYRGVSVHSSGQEAYVKGLRTGDSFDMPLASFTDKRDVAERFTGMGGAVDALTIFVLQKNARAVRGGPMVDPDHYSDPDDPFFDEWFDPDNDGREWITGGRFRVMSVHKTNLGGYGTSKTQVTYVYIKQLGVFDPDSGAIETKALEPAKQRFPLWELFTNMYTKRVVRRTKSVTLPMILKELTDALSTPEIKAVIRHVRTPAGVHKYGQNIGTIIVPDPPSVNLVVRPSISHPGWDKVSVPTGEWYHVGKVIGKGKKEVWTGIVGDDFTNAEFVGHTRLDIIQAIRDKHAFMQPEAITPEDAPFVQSIRIPKAAIEDVAWYHDNSRSRRALSWRVVDDHLNTDNEDGWKAAKSDLAELLRDANANAKDEELSHQERVHYAAVARGVQKLLTDMDKAHTPVRIGTAAHASGLTEMSARSLAIDLDGQDRTSPLAKWARSGKTHGDDYKKSDVLRHVQGLIKSKKVAGGDTADLETLLTFLKSRRAPKVNIIPRPKVPAYKHVWKRGQNQFGKTNYTSDTPIGRFVVDGNGRPPMKWSVTYPDGDSALGRTKAEVMAEADGWLKMKNPTELKSAIEEALETLVTAVQERKDRVRTPEGARMYGQPIGTVIHRDRLPNRLRVPGRSRSMVPRNGGNGAAATHSIIKPAKSEYPTLEKFTSGNRDYYVGENNGEWDVYDGANWDELVTTEPDRETALAELEKYIRKYVPINAPARPKIDPGEPPNARKPEPKPEPVAPAKKAPAKRAAKAPAKKTPARAHPKITTRKRTAAKAPAKAPAAPKATPAPRTPKTPAKAPTTRTAPPKARRKVTVKPRTAGAAPRSAKAMKWQDGYKGMHKYNPKKDDAALAAHGLKGAQTKGPNPWTEVYIADNLEEGGIAFDGSFSGVWCKGRDAAGRVQSKQLKARAAKAQLDKWPRIAALTKHLPALDKKLKARRGDDVADCIALILATGMRPSSEKDTGTDRVSYGATTFQVQHVTVEGKGVRIQMDSAKKGHTDLFIDDPDMVAIIKAHMKGKKKDEQVFSGTTEEDLRAFMATELPPYKGDEKFLVKDIRSMVGTALAKQVINDINKRQKNVPESAAEFRRLMKEVCDEVSGQLCNKPNQAAKSYIDPTVWDTWLTNGDIEWVPKAYRSEAL